MQCLCIGSDSNDDEDGGGDSLRNSSRSVIIWEEEILTHELLSDSTSSCRFFLLFFLNEWRKIPKDFWAHLQNECNVNCKWTPLPSSPLSTLKTLYNHADLFEPVFGDKSLPPKSSFKTLQSRSGSRDWKKKSYVTMITTHLRYKNWQAQVQKFSFWCLFNPLNVFFNIYLCLFACRRVVCVTFVFSEKKKKRKKFKRKWAFMTICFERNHRNVQLVWMLMQLYLRKYIYYTYY